MRKQHLIQLSDAERARATLIRHSVAAPQLVRTRAAILLAADAGHSDLRIATEVGTSVSTAQRTRRRYAAGGFGRAVGWEPPGVEDWADGVLAASRRIDGVVGAALVDYDAAVCLGAARDGALVAGAAANAAVVRAKLTTLRELGLADAIEDILITAPDKYHLIRVVPGGRPLFLYVVLDRRSGTLAMARDRLLAIDLNLAV